jgi:hypothetical protein
MQQDNFIKQRETQLKPFKTKITKPSRCTLKPCFSDAQYRSLYLDGVLLEGCDDEKDPVVRVERLGEQLPGLLGRVVHVQVLL